MGGRSHLSSPTAGDPEAEIVIPHNVEERAMELIGAGASGDHYSAGPIHFCRGVVRLDVEFLDGIHSRRASGDFAYIAITKHCAVLKRLDAPFESPYAGSLRCTIHTRYGLIHQGLEHTAADRKLIEARTVRY